MAKAPRGFTKGVIKGGKKKKKQSEKTAARNEEESGAEEPEAQTCKVRLSRGQHKRLSKKSKFLNKNSFVQAALREEAIHREGGLADLSAIGGAADAALNESPASAVQDSVNNKKPQSRKARMLANEREMAQFKQVVEFNAFKQDPFGAIEQHLKNSITKQRKDEKEKRDTLRAKMGARASVVKARQIVAKQIKGEVAARLTFGKAGVIKSSLKKKSRK